jgi:hypothetical protein
MANAALSNSLVNNAKSPGNAYVFGLTLSNASASLVSPFFFALRLARCKFFANRSFLVNSEWFAKWFTFLALNFPTSTDDPIPPDKGHTGNALFPPPQPPREYEMF